MRLQVLVSTMHQKDHTLLSKMNIQTDAIIINQCDENSFEEFEYNGHRIQWYSLAERGVGLSRNTALMRADADILLFADDDFVYEDGYEQTVLNFFEQNPKMSVAVFNLKSLNKERPEYIDEKDHRVHMYNCLKYGASRFAMRRTAIFAQNINFSLLFGGGAKFQAGEDNLFLANCLQKNLQIKASSSYIGTVKQESSTWFHGYNEKYYFDRGALFSAMYGKNAKFWILLLELKSLKKQSSVPLNKRIHCEFQGIGYYRNQK